ncbi:ATP-binding cassette domain-containing protein [Candidatus Saccharibacteria bacterium]|nr:ATP-binding cassette domain-containing protein [Candidatus Saccharibacteria bacterium]
MIIEVENIQKIFDDSQGRTVAIKDISLQVKKGQILGLLGPNGSGKTTLVDILATLSRPTGGSARVAGIDVAKDPAKVREKIGLAGQFAAVDENLTGRENLEMVGRLYHLGKVEAKKRAAEVLKRISLEDAADRTVKGYSGGMRRRLDLGASLLYRPEVLFLDEPTTGLDPKTRIDLWGLIREMVDDGTTLLLTTQYLEEADELADNIVVINKGEVVAEGTSNELKKALGADQLSFELSDRSKTKQAKSALDKARIATSPINFDRTGAVMYTVKNGVKDLEASIDALRNAKIEISHVSLAQPSLDDVFLQLTGDSDE